jgi:hypothetical protein
MHKVITVLVMAIQAQCIRGFEAKFPLMRQMAGVATELLFAMSTPAPFIHRSLMAIRTECNVYRQSSGVTLNRLCFGTVTFQTDSTLERFALAKIFEL